MFFNGIESLSWYRFISNKYTCNSPRQNISNIRDSLDIFLEQNPDLTQEEVANPERMVGIYGYDVIFKFISSLSKQKLKFSKQEEEKRPFYNELSFGLDDDNNVKTKG